MDSKKKLILIGNKPITENYSFIDSEYDYVFRVNKMNNYINTGKRIDGLYLGAFPDFSACRGGEFREYYKEAKNIYMIPWLKRFFWDYDKYISKDQFDNIIPMNLEEAKRALGVSATSTVCVLWHLLNKMPEFKEYEITLAGLDIDNREELLKTGDPWKNSGHSSAGAVEESYIKSLINTNQIKFIDLQ